MDKEKKSAKTYSNPTSLEKLIKENKPTEPKKEVMLKDISQKNLYMKLTATNNAFIYVYYPTPTSKKSITIGKYPTISLAVARQKANELREQLEQGLNPQQEKKKAELTFGEVAGLWLKEQEKRGLATFTKNIKGRVDNHLLPHLADKKIKDLKRNELVEIIKNLELKDKRGDGYETKSKTFGILKNILKLVSIEGLLDDYISPLADLEFGDFFKEKHQTKHHRFIKDIATLREFLLAVDNYKGNKLTKKALQFAIYTALRSANVRKLKWSWIDFSANLITIPADEMKMKKPFILPMSEQVTAILKSVDKISELVFSHNEKPMSDNTLNKAIKIAGFGDIQDLHGLRHLFSTNLNELHQEHRLNAEIIELCLAHTDKNEVRASYNQAERIAEKRELMSFYAKFIDEVKRGERG